MTFEDTGFPPEILREVSVLLNLDQLLVIRRIVGSALSHFYFYFKNMPQAYQLLLVAGAISAPQEEHMSYAVVLSSLFGNNCSEFLRLQNGNWSLSCVALEG